MIKIWSIESPGKETEEEPLKDWFKQKFTSCVLKQGFNLDNPKKFDEINMCSCLLLRY